MKKIMDLIANELAAAFEAAGYDKEYAKVTLSNRSRRKCKRHLPLPVMRRNTGK